MNTNKGFFALLSCGFILAIFALFVRLLNGYIGPLTQVGARMLVATIIVFPYLILKKIPLKLNGIKMEAKEIKENKVDDYVEEIVVNELT